MTQIKKALYGAYATALALSPLAASAQWGQGISNAGEADLPSGSIIGIIEQTMYWLLAILGFIGIIGFVIAGILYLTAAGDESQIEKAKNAMTYSIIGVIVALIGFVIIQAVTQWLGGGTSSF
ncbi:MAG: hypothetical protein A2808_02080 [Candidatus Moranbacteria bacterium RIFCSPHIGHO2_01_FULL_55_24]|nr:MAG: hypothetical protein A2808_02080 [Candidatus Moranbacteria bacterium RIFCSPHIGHO2_01_FULL_55_24]